MQFSANFGKIIGWRPFSGKSWIRRWILLKKLFCALGFAFIFAQCEWILRIRQMWTSVHFPFNNHFLFLLSVHLCLKNCRCGCRQGAAGRIKETCRRDVTFRIITQALLPIIVHLLTLSFISHMWLWSRSEGCSPYIFHPTPELFYFLFNNFSDVSNLLLFLGSLFVCVFKQIYKYKTFQITLYLIQLEIEFLGWVRFRNPGDFISAVFHSA